MVPRTPAELERVVETLTEIARRRSPISEDIDLMIAIECVSEVANYRALALGISKMVSERDETIRSLYSENDALRAKVEKIVELCDENLGEWSGVNAVHAPLAMAPFYQIRETLQEIQNNHE